jgi:PKD repeat protein
MKNLSFKREIFVLMFSSFFLNLSSQSFTETTPSNILPDTYAYYNRSSATWVDIDNDKDLDLFLLESEHPSRLFRNDGPGIFTPVSLPFSAGQAAAFGDYNNDGSVDFVMCGSPVRIYKNDGTGTFTALPDNTIQMNNESGSLDWGDYDNDGDLDLVSNSIVFRNNGSDSFTLMESISFTAAWEGSSKWGDYDNDGMLDVLISGSSTDGKIAKIYRNNGNGIFTEVAGLPLTPGFYGSTDWGDYDNDGDLDILMTGYTGDWGYTKVFRNNGNSNFTEITGLPFPTIFKGSSKWGDYDNDGDLDILISGFQNLSSAPPLTRIYTNNGNNSFTLYSGFEFTGVGGGSATWGDYDNDGRLDIAIIGTTFTPEQSVAKIYKNDLGIANKVPDAPTGLSSFVENLNVTLRWEEVTTDNTPNSSISYNIRIGTLSGKNDIMPSNSAGNGYRKVVGFGNVWQNNTATFKLPCGTYFWNVQAVDNGFAGGPFSLLEGTFSIVPVQASWLNATISNPSTLKLKWTRGTGDRCVVFCKQTSSGTADPQTNTTYTPDSEFGYGSQIGSTGWYTLYNGRADSVVVSGLLSNKQYSFQIFEYSGISGTEQYMALVADGNPGVFSTSSFTEQTGITESVNPASNNKAIWGDYDNDGFLDIFVLGSPSKIYKNNGNNTFAEKSTIFPSIERGSAAWGDYDKDGDLDLLISGLSTNPVTTIYENKGGDIFEELLPNVFTPVCWSSVAWGDYDSDGDLDILINGSTGSAVNTAPVTKVYKNNGDGSFSEETSIALTGLNKGSVIWADYDNDGDLDIINTGSYATYDHKIEIYQNQGNGSFTLQNQINIPGLNFSSVSPGDYDNDGDLDLLISYIEGVYIYENIGNGNFQVSLSFQKLTGTYEAPCFADWLDYNNDGYLDFVITNPYYWFTRVYRNTKGIFEPGALSDWFTLQDGSLKHTGNAYVSCGDYDNDGDADILLSSGDKFSIIANNFIMKSGSFQSNRTPQRPQNAVATNTPTGVLLSWDPVDFDETASKTMTYNVKVGTSENTSNICAPNPLSTGLTMGNAQMGTTFLLKNLPTGTYYWRVQAVDQTYKGGQWSTLGSFEVKNVQAFFSSDQVCSGLPTHFTDQSVASKGIASWSWDFGDGTTSILQNPQHTYASSGAYDVTLLITDSESAQGSLIQSVIVKSKPTTNFTAVTVCQGTATTFTNTTNNNGLSVSSWFWDFGNGQTSLLQTPPPHPYLGAADYTVVLRAQADNGCVDEVTKVVTVASIPIAGITADAPLTFCSGEKVTLSVPLNSDYAYIWKRSGATITGAVTNTYVAQISGSYTAAVTNTKGNCTTISSSVPVVVNNTPVAPLITAGGNQTFCQGDSVMLSAANTNGYIYQWRLNSGAVGTNLNQYSANASGIYSLVVTNSDGCSAYATNTITVNVNPKPTLPTVNISGPATFCQGGSVEMSVVNDNSVGYQWEKDGTGMSGALTNSYVAQAPGTYSLKISNSNGCFIKSENVSVNVLPIPASPSISPTGPIQFCQGDSVSLSVSKTTGYTYQWKLNGGAVGSNSNLFSAKNAGTYSLVVSNSNGCTASSSNTVGVTVNSLPSASAVNLSGAAQFCSGGSITLSVSPVTGYTYAWRNETGLISSAKTNSYLATTSGKYQLDITNSLGCSITTSAVNVVVKPSPANPTIDKGNYTAGMCLGETPIRLKASSVVSGYSYQWYKNGVPYSNSSTSVIEGFLQAGIYKLEADLGGCKSKQDTLNVYFEEALLKPDIYATGPTIWYLVCSNENASGYKWYYNGTVIPGADKYMYVANQKLGKYNVSISNAKGCFTQSDTITIPKGITGIEEVDPFRDLIIYPNPTSGLFTISLDNLLFGMVKISILDQSGKKILDLESEKVSDHFEKQIDLSRNAKGVYLISLQINRQISNKKIIIE